MGLSRFGSTAIARTSGASRESVGIRTCADEARRAHGVPSVRAVATRDGLGRARYARAESQVSDDGCAAVRRARDGRHERRRRDLRTVGLRHRHLRPLRSQRRATVLDLHLAQGRRRCLFDLRRLRAAAQRTGRGEPDRNPRPSIASPAHETGRPGRRHLPAGHARHAGRSASHAPPGPENGATRPTCATSRGSSRRDNRGRVAVPILRTFGVTP